MADKVARQPRTPIERSPPSRLSFGDLLLGMAGVDASPEPSPDTDPAAANRREHPVALHRLVLSAVDNPGPGTGRGERGGYDAGMFQPADSYTLPIIVEPAEGAWHAYCPTLLDYGAAIWAVTREEAFAHISQVVRMVVGRLVEDGVPVPITPADHEPTAGEQIVTVQVPTLDVAQPA